jgi:hypothetical protein
MWATLRYGHEQKSYHMGRHPGPVKTVCGLIFPDFTRSTVGSSVPSSAGEHGGQLEPLGTVIQRQRKVIAATLKSRDTTIPFWRGLCRTRSVVTDEPVSPQRSSAGGAGRALRRGPAARLAWARAAGMAPSGAGGRGSSLARAPPERAARGVRADPSTSGRGARGRGMVWVHAAGGKGRLIFLYSRSRKSSYRKQRLPIRSINSPYSEFQAADRD